MKRTAEDKEFARLLKAGAEQPDENKWFTARVVGHLPQRQGNFALLGRVFFALAMLACVACWVYFLKDFTLQVITVKDILKFVMLFAVTLFTILMSLWQALESHCANRRRPALSGSRGRAVCPWASWH